MFFMSLFERTTKVVLRLNPPPPPPPPQTLKLHNFLSGEQAFIFKKKEIKIFFLNHLNRSENELKQIVP